MTKKRILVCGGRTYNDQQLVNVTLGMFRLANLATGIHIIEGGAQGADRLARVFAETNNIQYSTYEANWKEFGKSAGPRRNLLMIEDGRPDIVIMFKGGKGTADMKSKAVRNGIRVVEIHDYLDIIDMDVLEFIIT